MKWNYKWLFNKNIMDYNNKMELDVNLNHIDFTLIQEDYLVC